MAYPPPVDACTLIVNDHLTGNEADQFGNKTFQTRQGLVTDKPALALGRLLPRVIRVDGIILELAIERRPADSEPSRNLAHLTVVK